MTTHLLKRLAGAYQGDRSWLGEAVATMVVNFRARSAERLIRSIPSTAPGILILISWGPILISWGPHFHLNVHQFHLKRPPTRRPFLMTILIYEHPLVLPQLMHR